MTSWISAMVHHLLVLWPWSLLYLRRVDEEHRPEIENLEQRVELLLRDSKALLPEEADTEWFSGVMRTEQFELAFDELVRLGNEHRPAPGYWSNLIAAAGLMGRPEVISGLRARLERH